MKRRAEGDDTESDDKRSDVKTETYSLDEMSDVEDEGDVVIDYNVIYFDTDIYTTAQKYLPPYKYSLTLVNMFFHVN